jgi:hypothetical protein
MGWDENFGKSFSTAQQPKTAAQLSHFHLIPVVVSPRRGGGDPAKPLFYSRRGGGIAKRLSLCPKTAAVMSETIHFLTNTPFS